MKPSTKLIDRKVVLLELRSIPADQLLARYDQALKAQADATLAAEYGSANRKPAAQRLLVLHRLDASWVAFTLYTLCLKHGLITSQGIDPLS
jgi:hypothetical protein